MRKDSNNTENGYTGGIRISSRLITYMLLAMFLLPFFINPVTSQQRVICGRVTAFDTIIMKGVEVIARKSDEEVKTNEYGEYCIQVEENDRLKFKAKAFYNEKVKISDVDADTVNVNMEFIHTERNKKIATGLGYVSEDELTYAIDELSGANVDYSQYSNIYDLLQARIPGVDVVNRTITIRGMGSMTGNSEPLFVVDGVYRSDISDIHPSDVKSINVIKDGGTAMYGSRGANGVIVIETKR